MKINLDFETRSDCDLLTEGAYRYAMHPSTGVYMLWYAFGDEEPQVWQPGGELPQRLCEAIRDGSAFPAFNAQFERLIWWYVLAPDFGFPEIALEQFQCTAAQARAHGMPGNLGDCARALGLPPGMLKQAGGTRLIQQYSAWNVPWEDIPPEDQELFLAYGRQDVIVERAIGQCFRELTPYEWEEYHACERVNDRGIPVDLKLARAALDYAEDVRADVDGKILTLTGGKVKTARQRKTRDEWLLPQLTPDAESCLVVHRNGERKLSFAETQRSALMLHPDTPVAVVRYLELVTEAGGATISKYQGILNREVDGRVPGALMFNGAGKTGRYSSRGFQAHNMRRDSFDDPEPVIADLMEGYELPDVTDTLAKLIRSAVYRPGEGLSWCDWSAIEGRMAPWLANTDSAERKLDRFRFHDAHPGTPDVYMQTAGDTYNKDPATVTKEERQAGKIQELAFQFLGGVGAAKVMARAYGIHLTEAEALKLRDAWRKANPWAQRFGKKLESAASKALRRPDQWFEAGRVAFAYDGAAWLWMRLPSGRLLAYFMPRFEQVEAPWGEMIEGITCVWGAGKPKVGEEWPRRNLYGGLYIENAAQAASADLLRDALLLCEDEDVPVVLHVHDEIVAQGSCYALLRDIMTDVPGWAAGLPLAAEGGEGERYGK